MNITFPPRQEFSTVWDWVTFPAEVDGRPVECHITREALQARFGAKGFPLEEVQGSFVANRPAIEQVVRSAIQGTAGQPIQVVLIMQHRVELQ